MALTNQLEVRRITLRNPPACHDCSKVASLEAYFEIGGILVLRRYCETCLKTAAI